jgi:cytoskeletal protein CcmA (bactofilin family)
MKSILFLGLALATLVPAANSQRDELGGKVRSGREVTIPAGQTVQGDLIASGGTVRIDGRVDGDLVANGGQVTVAGTVSGDLLTAAGRTTISGEVDGDARVATGQLTVQRQARVGEDLLIGAGQATIDEGARVGGDLIFGAGRMTMDGTVAGSILGSTGNYTQGGSVAGTERVNVGQPQQPREPTLADRLLGGLRRYVSILVVGVLLLWLLPRLFRGAAEAARRRPLASLGVGVLGFIGVIVALVLLVLVTVLVAVVLGLLGLGSLTGVTVFGGLLLAMVVVFLLVLAVVFAAPATVGLALGRLLVRGDGGSFLGWLGVLALGVLVVVLVAAIPVVGGWLAALLVVLGLGAVLLMARPGGRRLGEPSQLSPAGGTPGR